MTSLGTVAHRALRRFGYDLAPFPPVDSLGAHLRALFARLGINCVLDVGAHRGEYGRLLRTLGYRGRIVSFEPVVESFEAVQRCAASDPDWRVFPVALGAAAGPRPFHVTRDPAFSSFFSANPRGQHRFGVEMGIQRVERVSVTRLDAVFAECVDGIGAPRTFLKLDTQGADLEVLAGAGTRVDDIRALQCEVPVLAVYEGVDDYVTAIGRLNRMGFELTGIFAVSREPDLRLLELDCVLRRPEAPARSHSGQEAR
ncbi:MAG: FkbM family methyltransferase [Candidatus Rokubacteria bacterium]|nr:FkbM family methyltransferase [Candidatus Rokubacteria bacterium]